MSTMLPPSMNRCPFCHSPDVNTFECDVGSWAVSCMSCDAIGPAAASIGEAINRWNAAAASSGAEGSGVSSVTKGGF